VTAAAKNVPNMLFFLIFSEQMFGRDFGFF